MSLLPTAPRSIGAVLDDAIRLYRAVVPKCFLLLLLFVVVLGALGALLAYKLLTIQPANPADPLAVFRMFATPAVWGGYFGIMAVSVLIYNVLFVTADTVAHGAPVSLAGAVGLAARRWIPSLIVSIIFLLIIGVSSMLLIIPGIWLWGALQFCFVAVAVDGAGIFGSFGESYRLVKGNWWRSTTTMTVGFIIMYVLMLVIGIIVGMVSAMLHMTLVGRLFLQQGLSAVMNLFLLPFIPSLMLSIFYDLKLRHEGTDLAARVEALKAAG